MRRVGEAGDTNSPATIVQVIAIEITVRQEKPAARSFTCCSIPITNLSASAAQHALEADKGSMYLQSQKLLPAAQPAGNPPAAPPKPQRKAGKYPGRQAKHETRGLNMWLHYADLCKQTQCHVTGGCRARPANRLRRIRRSCPGVSRNRAATARMTKGAAFMTATRK